MPEFIYEKLNPPVSAAGVIISVALMLFAGFAITRLTKLLHIPNVTAYIVAGILLGQYGLSLVPQDIAQGMDFIADIALAFIAFGAGEFFRFDELRRNGVRVAVITVLESLMASLFVFVAAYFLLGLGAGFSAVLAALAAATAPASTVVTIRQTGASGNFVSTLLQVVAMDDAVGLIAFSIAISVSMSLGTGGLDVWSVTKPLLANLFVLLLGCAFGFLIKLLMPSRRSTDNRLIILIAVLFTFCGVCALLDTSPLLGCMSMGAVYINITGDSKLFRQLNYFSPPVLLLFFVRSGIIFDLGALTGGEKLGGCPLFLVGIVYFITRIAGKYVGAFAGCAAVKSEKSLRNYLGLALIPQAGVAIGLAALGARTLGGSEGAALQTVILASSVLYELIGPGCAKLSLYLSHSYPVKETERKKELPPHTENVSEEEKAFLEAAQEHCGMTGAPGDTVNLSPAEDPSGIPKQADEGQTQRQCRARRLQRRPRRQQCGEGNKRYRRTWKQRHKCVWKAQAAPRARRYRVLSRRRYPLSCRETRQRRRYRHTLRKRRY